MAMSDRTCPWCEAELELLIDADEQQCPECRTLWRYEDESEAVLPIAA
jgi:hypothetical protein